jgi:hypothetical protein
VWDRDIPSSQLSATDEADDEKIKKILSDHEEKKIKGV